jgi:hypothetical protein
MLGDQIHHGEIVSVLAGGLTGQSKEKSQTHGPGKNKRKGRTK